MATIVLQTVGGALGGAIGGPFGMMAGRALGAVAGSAIDQQVFQKDQVINGPRLQGSKLLSSIEGSAIPKVYGRAQIGGQIIWATRFEEVVSTKKQGGKGGPTKKTTEYSYFANFAVGICAGPVARIGRIWADGNEIDLPKHNHRIYYGSDTQPADPLIEGLQSTGNTPAYRGLAYVVFEDFPLASYGNRIPQLTFEVIRTIGQLENSIRSVCLIPGSTAFGYSPQKLISDNADGETLTHNRHVLVAPSDWSASIDELQQLCPNLVSVSLVVAWFGTDLRADQCQIKPGVERVDIDANDHPWLVSGISPPEAHQISLIDNKPAFGSTPTDQSIIAAITDLKSRGLKVTFYPFIMMDISPTQNLPDPYGRTKQPSFPWRGRITCDPAIGEIGSVDQTVTATTQTNNFLGNAAPGDFVPSGTTVNYIGSLQWSYKRMILHYAHLCNLAGGVDNFLVGSEMRALSNVRNESHQFPFVDGLITLATNAKSILGTATKVTYAADWSEYFGYHPQDGSNDLFFNLDPLWASSSIDAVGIDNYMPTADWRDNGDPGDPTASEYSVEYFSRNIAGGEGFDWFYASNENRQNAIRTPVTDGLGEPWVWRFKDIKSWWSNPHYERQNGVSSPTSTLWQPQSKPVWFTELGCPAINKGANQPNVFYDPKSSESAAPYFSSGNRDDLMQRRFLQAQMAYWGSGPQIDQHNPASTKFTGRMVDMDQTSLWAWDARSFPAFPSRTDVWSDGENWIKGHWLTARLGSCSLDDLVAEILDDYSFHQYDVNDLTGWLNGFVIPSQAPARQVLEPLLDIFGATANTSNGVIKFISPSIGNTALLRIDDFVEPEDQSVLSRHRERETELPNEAIIYHDEIRDKMEAVASKSRRIEGQNKRQVQMQLPAVLPSQNAVQLADARVRDAWIGREKLQFSLPPQALQFTPTDVVSIDDQRYSGLWQIQAIEDGYDRQMQLKKIEAPGSMSFAGSLPPSAIVPNSSIGKPLALLLDIPRQMTEPSTQAVLVSAATAKPWAGIYDYASSPEENGFEIRKSSTRQATIAKLISALPAGPQGRWDYANNIHLKPVNGVFEGGSMLKVLNGENAIGVQTDTGNWEIIQFQNSELQSDGSYKLSKLLRAQLGSELEMEQGHSIGNYVVALNQGVEYLAMSDLEKNLPLQWRIGPGADPVSSASYAQQTLQFTDKASRPFSPVHIRSKKLPNDDVKIFWTRRSRIYGDDWQVNEIPLGESQEGYRVQIFDGASMIREFDVTTPAAVYSGAAQIADFGMIPTTISMAVSQLDAFNNAGAARAALLGPFS